MAQKYTHTSYARRMEKSVKPIMDLFTPLSHSGFVGVCTDSETTSEFCLNSLLGCYKGINYLHSVMYHNTFKWFLFLKNTARCTEVFMLLAA